METVVGIITFMGSIATIVSAIIAFLNYRRGAGK